ncbi:GNAT family N-acetyltransferase [Promicromonospora sukumoe]
MTEPMVLVEVRPDDHALLSGVIDLADRNRRTLGLMPRSVIAEFARRRHLLVARAGTELAAYALYDVARRRVRLVHLCVDETYRGRGAARILVSAISDKHKDLTGIALKCRRDNPASDVWPRLGFEAKNEGVGRGKDQEPLVYWWRDHGIPDLFSSAASDGDTVVAIDHNVFIDLALRPERAGAEESQALEADWLTDLISLAITHETPNEINRIDDEQERRRHRSKLGRFRQLSYGPADLQHAEATWAGAVGTIPDEDLADCRHIVSAAAGGAPIFVTRDEELIARYGGTAADVFGLRVLRPSDLIAHLDEVANAAKYRPVDLQGTGFNVSAYGADAEVSLDRFLNQADGEKKRDFRRLLRTVVADPSANRQWVHEPSGKVAAAWVTRHAADGRALEVPLFRVDGRSALGTTLGRLITLDVKQRALTEGKTVVHISDPHITRELRPGLVVDGFHSAEGLAGSVSAVLDCRSTEQTLHALEDHPLRERVEAAIAAATTTGRVADLERTLWPVKFLDSDLPTYVVPIRPAWADQLLGLNRTLWARPDLLGISRELVYYRAPNNNPSSPARIAWYASGTGPRGVGGVVAVSRLVAVDTDAPERLHRRYQHLGAYRLEDVRQAARNGRASALKFVDTEKLAKRVPYERLRALSGRDRLSTLQSPTRISSELFGQVYLEGTGRNV